MDQERAQLSHDERGWLIVGEQQRVIWERPAVIEPPETDVAEAESPPRRVGEVVDEEDAAMRTRPQLLAGLGIDIETRHLRGEIPESRGPGHVQTRVQWSLPRFSHRTPATSTRSRRAQHRHTAAARPASLRRCMIPRSATPSKSS